MADADSLDVVLRDIIPALSLKTLTSENTKIHYFIVNNKNSLYFDEY